MAATSTPRAAKNGRDGDGDEAKDGRDMNTGMSVLIAEHIVGTLKGSADLEAMLKGQVTYPGGRAATEWRIYPLSIPAGTGYPYVAVLPEETAPHYETKDGGADWDEDVVTVACVSKRYPQAVQLGQRVRKALECVTATYDGWRVVVAEVTVARQFYVEKLEAYAVELEMRFETEER